MNIDIQIATILSNRTKKGMIEFEITELNDDNFPNQKIKTQWDVNKARQIRDMLQEAIEAAISDEMIYTFMREKVGLSEEKASMVLLDFRFIRQGSKGTIYPS